MMQRQYLQRVRAIDNRTGVQVLRMLGVKPGRRRERDWLFRRLDKSGHDQADLVLCLLRLNQLRHVERLMGHHITRCPCAYKWRPVPAAIPDRAGDTRRVIHVAEEFRLKKGKGRRAWLPRYKLFQVGMTVAQLMRRGIRQGDLRRAEKRGWIALSAAA